MGFVVETTEYIPPETVVVDEYYGDPLYVDPAPVCYGGYDTTYYDGPSMRRRRGGGGSGAGGAVCGLIFGIALIFLLLIGGGVGCYGYYGPGWWGGYHGYHHYGGRSRSTVYHRPGHFRRTRTYIN